jgi:hypothetical protein
MHRKSHIYFKAVVALNWERLLSLVKGPKGSYLSISTLG